MIKSQNQTDSWLKWHAITLISGWILTAIAYGNIINSFFLSDDFNWIYQIKTRGVFGVWTTPPDVFFRPLISLTLFADYQLWELNPLGYHLTNLFFHGLNAFLVYAMSRLLFRGADLAGKLINIFSLVSGFIFIILHSHVEAVTWISARSDLVATCFGLAAFCGYLKYKETDNNRLFFISYILFFLGLLSKESVIIYPGLVLLYELYNYLNKNNYINLLKILYLPLMYASVLPIYLGLRYLGIRQFLGGYGSGVHTNFNLDIIQRGLASSLRIIIPPLPNIPEENWVIFFAIFMTIICTFVVVCLCRQGVYILIAKLAILLLGLFGTSLLPVINIRISLSNTEGERLLYLPSAFLVILLVLVIGVSLARFRVLLAIQFMIISIILSYYLYSFNQNWNLAGNIAKQVIESIDQEIQGRRMFLINIPDNLNGVYIYRNGLYAAGQLFAESEIELLNNATFNNLINPSNALNINRIGDREYWVKLLSPGTYFMNVHIPFDQRLETQNFIISDVDFQTMQSFRIQIKDRIQPGEVGYYSGGRVINTKWLE
ncbi:MAG: hypothetical protein P5702_00965 [Limnospira sp. PMC 1291.21]|uniref:Glycosyltransferase RgtA/B/C/D-like domain-containing protein n=2 Tax=Limnospira TaxID=2596745 RepID=A0A9P1KCF0_9CYAN|nr:MULTISPECIES: hypothetical protein [Limnospira]UWU50832.1 hypothetical protein APLC1_5777 [Arthrospira platensis C1]MDT9176273.1 hypothetical protein [Limnospira sp. PMC 1238.20]MDT9191587.1 hypothetical protein [Limnospira sp. PMC 1245.20]MDT9196849.1 hypothetical protein [Limnospira sp. PMC 1042.18]MDT9201947.1 hypothetical protein [Limnospira sp. PMC 1243.20]